MKKRKAKASKIKSAKRSSRKTIRLKASKAHAPRRKHEEFDWNRELTYYSEPGFYPGE